MSTSYNELYLLNSGISGGGRERKREREREKAREKVREKAREKAREKVRERERKRKRESESPLRHGDLCIKLEIVLNRKKLLIGPLY